MISAEVNILRIKLQGKGSPLTYKLNKSELGSAFFVMSSLARCMGFHEIYSYALFTKREVKMAGYRPSSFAAFLWTSTQCRSIKTQKMNEVNIQLS